jgi:parallel beta-helix repeat protein
MARIRATLGGFVAASQPAPVTVGATAQANVVRPATAQPAPTQVTQPVARAPIAAAPIATAPTATSIISSLADAADDLASNVTTSVSNFFNLTSLRTTLARQVATTTTTTTAATTAARTGNTGSPTTSGTSNGGSVTLATAQSLPGGTFATGGGGTTGATAGGTGTTYYVDFATGNDSNSGTSASRPWKRAPGDPQATANAAAAQLVGGDTVRFRGGVSYRGSIEFEFSGDPGNPIVYAGTGFGTGNAIIDGADLASSSVPCPNAAACGNAGNWASLRLVTFTKPATTYLKLFDATGPLSESFVPSAVDAFFGDDIDNFAVTPVAAAAAIAAGRLENAQLAAAAQGQPFARVALWVQPNKVVERKILSVSGNTIYFDNTDIRPYTDRDGRAAIVGSVRGLTRPGAYAVIADGKAVVFPRAGGGTQVFIGTGRYGIDLNGKANVRVSGFRFLRSTSSPGAIREGIAITNIGPSPSNVTIDGNFFGPLSMRTGYGAINLSDGTDVVIRGNRFTDLQWGSGIRLGAGVVRPIVEGNRLTRGGRTGIYLQDTTDAIVRGNIISGYEGQHGNAMSFYQGNRNVTVSGNCVFNSARPLTFHGDDGSLEQNDIRITGNILVASADSSAAINSWGNKTRKVTISGNLLLGPKFGAILSAQDMAVTVTRNRTTGVTVSGGVFPGDWVVSQNDESVDYAAARNAATLSLDRCSALGPQGTITVTPL